MAPTSVNEGRSSVQRPGSGPLADHDVEPEVLERRVEDLLDRAVNAMDLVDEQHVALLERGQDRGHVALALERRAGHRAQPHPELLADDLGERRLAEAGRADEQHVVESLAARLRGLEHDRELFLRPLLPHEVGEPAGTERGLELLVLLPERGREELGAHAAIRSANRTCSSTVSSGSTSARARSASTSE